MEPDRTCRGLVYCRRCDFWQSYISQTPVQPQLEHKKRRESVCCMCGYRHRFTTRPFPYPNGRKGSMRFVKYPSNIDREILVENAKNLNFNRAIKKEGSKLCKFKNYKRRGE